MRRTSCLARLAVLTGGLAPLCAASLAQAQIPPSAMTEDVAEVFANVENLEDIEVHGSLGDVIGDVRAVVVDEEGVHHVVVEVGGFLGIGEDRVAVPLTSVAARGDASLALVGITEDQLEAMAEWTEDTPGFTVVEPAR
jgi:sporulation protein YlmC with PRC-barrel domain